MNTSSVDILVQNVIKHRQHTMLKHSLLKGIIQFSVLKNVIHFLLGCVLPTDNAHKKSLNLEIKRRESIFGHPFATEICMLSFFRSLIFFIWAP